MEYTYNRSITAKMDLNEASMHGTVHANKNRKEKCYMHMFLLFFFKFFTLNLNKNILYPYFNSLLSL